jgi:hypothetical protein
MKTSLFGPSETTERYASQANNGLNLKRGEAQFTRCLDIDKVSAGLHEKAEAITQPVYRISWNRKPIRLFGRWSLPGRERSSGKFVRVSPDRIKVPLEAVHRYEMARNRGFVDEIAAFIDTRLRNSNVGVILAVKNGGSWRELYRWHGPWKDIGLSRLDISSM